MVWSLDSAPRSPARSAAPTFTGHYALPEKAAGTMPPQAHYRHSLQLHMVTSSKMTIQSPAGTTIIESGWNIMTSMSMSWHANQGESSITTTIHSQ